MPKINKLTKAIFAFSIAGLFLSFVEPVTVKADNSSYGIVIDDSADFLTDAQEESLQEEMSKTAEYCNAVFVTTTSHQYSSTENYATSYYESCYPNESGVIFVIDRDLDQIYLLSEGSARSVISSSRCLVITDNTYRYATTEYDCDYYTCAFKTFEQVNTLLEGGRIAQPMKYISNVFFALVLAMLINFFIVLAFSRSKKPSLSALLGGSFTNVEFRNKRKLLTHQTKTYSPQSHGDGGGGGGGGGGHSGGGHGI